LYVFVECMTSLSAIIFLISPGNMPAQFVIFDTASKSFFGTACAQSVTILCVVFLAMGFIGWFEKYGPRWARLGTH
ncbi:MAG: hypothetical protein ABIA76_04755, partial [Candidatus Diapherotrites archaeon]